MRAIEIIADGVPKTGFMMFGDTIRMIGKAADGSVPFGVLEQRVVQAPPGSE